MDNEKRVELYNIWMININAPALDDLTKDFDEQEMR